jgi:Endomembrane protein 70
MIGTGIQLLVSLFLFTFVGFIYDTNQLEYKNGSQKTIGIIIFAFTGVFNGYYSAKYYKYMGGKHLALNLISSACLFPVKIITCFFIHY